MGCQLKQIRMDELLSQPLGVCAICAIERKVATMQGTDRRLMFHGMCLFILGLITGFAEQHFAKVRMGLAYLTTLGLKLAPTSDVEPKLSD
jgi:hypothetical protein